MKNNRAHFYSELTLVGLQVAVSCVIAFAVSFLSGVLAASFASIFFLALVIVADGIEIGLILREKKHLDPSKHKVVERKTWMEYKQLLSREFLVRTIAVVLPVMILLFVDISLALCTAALFYLLGAVKVYFAEPQK